MFFSLITLLSIIKFVAPCQGINGCTLCNHYATCIQCDSHHKLQHDVCVYDPQPTSTLNQPHRTNQNHIPTSLTITSRNPRATEFSINHNTGIQNSMSMTLVFSGVGARHQIVEDNCGFRYSGICIFCV